MMNTELFRTFRQSFRILAGVLLMLHLSPLVTTAWGAMLTPLNDIRLIDRDTLNLSDIFTDVPSDLDKALGPAPQPGQDIVLNAHTLLKLAIAYNVNWRPVSASDQITLRRDGTLIEPETIKTALISALQTKGITGSYELSFSSPLAPLILGKDVRTDITITRLDYDPTRSAFTAVFSPAAAPARQIGVSGLVERLIDVPVARRTLARGDLINASDIDTLAIRQKLIKADTITRVSDLIGQSPRRAIAAGKVIGADDVEIPLNVKRGDKIHLIYRLGAMELSAQGRAVQDGRPGDRIRVVNIDSNKPLQGTVTGESRVVID